MADAPGALLRSLRFLGRVVKVFGEISDVLPSDAHQIARYRAWTQEIADIGQKVIKTLFWDKILSFRRFGGAKPFQPFQRGLRFVCDVLRAF